MSATSNLGRRFLPACISIYIYYLCFAYLSYLCLFIYLWLGQVVDPTVQKSNFQYNFRSKGSTWPVHKLYVEYVACTYIIWPRWFLTIYFAHIKLTFQRRKHLKPLFKLHDQSLYKMYIVLFIYSVVLSSLDYQV